MGLFDQIAGSIGGQILQQLGGGGGQQNPLLQMVAGLLQQPGGLQGLIDQLQKGGLGAQAASWVGTGSNLPVEPGQLQQASHHLKQRILLAAAAAELLEDLAADASGDLVEQSHGFFPLRSSEIPASHDSAVRSTRALLHAGCRWHAGAPWWRCGQVVSGWSRPGNCG